MFNIWPNRKLVLPPRPNDIFDANYHPDLEALSELKYKALKKAGLINNQKSNSDEDARYISKNMVLTVLVGIPVFSILIVQLAPFPGL